VSVRQKEALRVVEVGCAAVNELGTDAFHGTWYAWPGHALMMTLMIASVVVLAAFHHVTLHAAVELV